MQLSNFNQPLLWFALIACLLFLLDRRRDMDGQIIFVTTEQAQRLATLWESQTGLIPSSQELESLINNWVKEEIMYREALRLGLQQNDSIVRRRLVQKLGFIVDSEQDRSENQSEESLRQFYEDNIEDYTLPVRYTFQQLFFATEEAAEDALLRIQNEKEIESLGEPSMLNASYAYRSILDLNATFGGKFSDGLKTLDSEQWDGPLQSGFGFHLVKLADTHEAEIRPISLVQYQVAQDYLQYLEDQNRNMYVNSLMGDYTVQDMR